MSDISEIDELYSPAPESDNGLNYDLIADEPFTFIYEFPPNGHVTGSDIPNHDVVTLPLKARQKRRA
ncbi:hypothetical protein PAXINDRAFT_9311 [Paxillus involutus ATCC 200175]|nr:hypothetical protein PAXINDRAFT_9311 [Paxillus involutus ATCC 200175]